MDGPSVSVVVVCDRVGAGERSWDDERRVLRALAGQDYERPFEVIVVDHAEWEERIPPDLLAIVPGTRILPAPASQSSLMKDAGVSAASGEWVAVFEADNVPSPDWLRLMLEAAARHPDAAAISGRGSYPGTQTSTVRRVLAFYHRASIDPGREGRTKHFNNAGSLVRREAWMRYPYPEAETPFISARRRLDAMLSAGERIYFQPAAVLEHAYGGWPFVVDVHRSQGFADMHTYAARRRYRAIPYLLFRRLRHEFGTARRVGRDYLRPLDWPLAIVALFGLRILEVPGMVDAVRDRAEPAGTQYR